MKLHRLELAGFGPFRDRQVVDFDAFDGDGIFLISGRTGAGKSSVLDGVSFALYGNVPRYDGGDKRLRSDHCAPEDPTEAVLEFTVGGSRWRVTRSPEYERPKRRGDGTTTEQPRAELFERVDGAWIGRASRPRDVAEVLDQVLGLNLQQFQQVILLAQNKFSRFLLAKNDERQGLLRTLFGTRRYEDYARLFDDRRREVGQRLRERGVLAEALLTEAERTAQDGGVDSEPGTVPDDDLAARRAGLLTAVQRAQYRAETAVHERRAAEERALAAERDLARLTQVRTAQRARDAAAETLAALERRADEMTIERGLLDAAVAAETLRPSLDAHARAAAEETAARAAAEAAREAWLAAGEDVDADLAAVDDLLTGEIAHAESAAEAERVWDDAVRDLAAHGERITALEAEIHDAGRRLAEIPAARAQLELDIDTVDREIAASAGAGADRDAIQDRLEAARRAETLAQQAAVADAAHADALDAVQSAVAAVAHLLRRRVAERAGELASALVAGERCPVCGSSEHPHPAAVSDDPVTDDALAAAEATREGAVGREAAAAAAAREVHGAFVAARERSGGADVAQLESEQAAAEAAVAAASAAGRRRDDLRGRIEALRAREDEARAAHDDRSAALQEVRLRVSALTATADAARERVLAARGAHANVADRLRDLRARRESARALRGAVMAAESAAAVAATTAGDLAARVEASAFPSVDDVSAALRPAAETAARRTRVDTHDRELAVVRARLLELQLELAGTPDEPVDLAAAEAAVAATSAERSAAIAAESRTASARERLQDLAVRADEAYAGVESLAAHAAAVTRLADTLQGRAPNTRRMTLETFVLAAELEEIVVAANLRLAEMSAGRYSLHHSDSLAARGAASGLGIEVMDAFTGRLRPPQSLSGGETFLASLSLALGLAEVVTARAGGVRLDTLFVDEGFGSLDGETLELAMRVLDELRTGGRTVGVISHVEAMKEQLAAQLVVEATSAGPSVIRQP
ncbi:SMC family ATPase [Microbacterium sp. NPDC089189]|uniref:SMC family ATPase n=1 Tax=Microbacterium sp. NPDC089189 TaxID=3154972 RepID=UPI00343B95E4